MTLIEQVKEDAQMLFDKRDVLKLLEKQKNEDIEKACTEVKHILNNELRENDTLSGVWVSDLIASVILNLEQSMKGE